MGKITKGLSVYEEKPKRILIRGPGEREGPTREAEKGHPVRQKKKQECLVLQKSSESVYGRK